MSYFELPEPRRERCPFCDNVAGRVSERGTRCAVVSETDLTLTFVAPRRKHLGRLLVISKRHAPTLLDLTDEEAAAIMRDTRRAALAVTRAFEGPLRNPKVVARKTLTPTLSHREREQERPLLREREELCNGLLRGAR